MDSGDPVELPRRVAKSDVEPERRFLSRQSEDGKPTPLPAVSGSTEKSKNEKSDAPYQRLSRKRLSPESANGEENRPRSLSNPLLSSGIRILSPMMARPASIEWERRSANTKCVSDIE